MTRSSSCALEGDHLCLLPPPALFVDDVLVPGLFLRTARLALPCGIKLSMNASLLKLGTMKTVGTGVGISPICEPCSGSLTRSLEDAGTGKIVCRTCSERAPAWDGLEPGFMLRSSEETVGPSDVKERLTSWAERFVPADPLTLVLAVDELATYLLELAEKQERIAEERGLDHVTR